MSKEFRIKTARLCTGPVIQNLTGTCNCIDKQSDFEFEESSSSESE